MYSAKVHDQAKFLSCCKSLMIKKRLQHVFARQRYVHFVCQNINCNVSLSVNICNVFLVLFDEKRWITYLPTHGTCPENIFIVVSCIKKSSIRCLPTNGTCACLSVNSTFDPLQCVFFYDIFQCCCFVYKKERITYLPTHGTCPNIF